MLEIALFCLVLQIRFNAALNYSGYNRNPLIPSVRFINSGQTRRLWDSDLSSRGIPNSGSEQSDSEYSSSEESSYRSVQPLQSLPYQKRNDYLRYNSRPDKDVRPEYVPIGRIGSKYVDNLQSSSSVSHRIDTNFRRPYLKHKPSNIRQGQKRKYYRKENDDLVLEASSIDSNSSEDVSPIEDDSSYLRSLSSFIVQPNNRRVENRKYYRKGDNLSLEVSPSDKLDLDEHADNGFLISRPENLDEYIFLESRFSKPHPPNEKQNRNNYKNHEYDLRFHPPSPAKDISDTYIDTVLLGTDDSKQDDDITIRRPKLRSLEQAGLSKNKYYNRRYDDVSTFELLSDDKLTQDDDITSNLSPFRGLKPRLRNHKLQSQKYKRKNNNNVGLKSSLIDKLFTDDDSTGHSTVLRLSSLEDLNHESPLLRSRDKKQRKNKKNNQVNFLRLSLSPNDKLTLDEDMASDLSKLLSEALDKLNVVPVNLRSSGSSNKQYSRRGNVELSLGLSSNDRISTDEDNLSNFSVFHLGSLDNSNVESRLLRYREPLNRNRNINLRRQENNEALKKLFDDNATRNLVPYYERRSNKSPNNSGNEEKINNWKDTDEYSLDTLFNDKEKDDDDRLNLDDNFASNLSVLHSKNLDNLSLELLRNSDEYQTKQHGTTDIRRLEFPWNNQLSPNEDKTSGLRSQSQLRNHEQIDNTEDIPDILQLESPWNDQLSLGDDKYSNVSTLPGLRSKSRIRISERKDSTNDALHLEFPWNNQLNPDDNKTNNLSALRGLKSQLKSRGQEDNAKETTDTLHLEFPWNNQLSPNEGKTSRKSRLRSQTDSRQDKDPKVYELNLEYPWNGKTSPEKETSSKKTATHSTDPLNQYPFPRNQYIHPNYYKQSYDDSLSNEDAGLLENLKDHPTESYLKKSDRRFNENQNLRVLSIAQQNLENDTVIFNYSNEGPNEFISLALDRRPHPRPRTQGENSPLYLGWRINPPLVTTTTRPNDVVSLINRSGGKTDRITYNDTIIFPAN